MAGNQTQKEEFGEGAVDLIVDSVEVMSGAGAAGTKTLTLADTWYEVPSTVPTSAYVLVFSKESAVGTLRWAFDNSSTPSATYGNRFKYDSVIAELAAGEVIYVASSSAGDVVNWTTKII